MPRKILISAAVVTAMAMTGTGAMAKTYTVVPDISDSSPMTNDPRQAARAGAFIARQLSNLKMGDRVSVRALGEYGKNRNWRLDVEISKRYRPYKVVGAVEKLVANIPALVKSGRLSPNGSTNIIGFLEDNARALDCANAGVVFIISDGIESSRYTNASKLVTGKAKPPKPPGQILSGCRFVMLGVGHSNDGSTIAGTKHIKRYWSAYFANTGAQFEAIPQF